MIKNKKEAIEFIRGFLASLPDHSDEELVKLLNDELLSIESNVILFRLIQALQNYESNRVNKILLKTDREIFERVKEARFSKLENAIKTDVWIL